MFIIQKKNDPKGDYPSQNEIWLISLAAKQYFIKTDVKAMKYQ